MKITKLFIVILSGLILTAFLSGCNTMKGMGEDISAGGKALTRAASHHSDHQKAASNKQKSSSTEK